MEDVTSPLRPITVTTDPAQPEEDLVESASSRTSRPTDHNLEFPASIKEFGKEFGKHLLTLPICYEYHK